MGEAIGFAVVGRVVHTDAGNFAGDLAVVHGKQVGLDALHVGNDLIPVAASDNGVGVVVSNDGDLATGLGDEQGTLPSEAAFEDQGQGGIAAFNGSRTKVSQTSMPDLATSAEA